MGGFFEGDFHIVAEVLASLRLSGVGPAAAEEFIQDAAAAENVAEDLEGVMETAAPISARATVEGVVAVLVVGGALLRIAQNFVGFAQFFEAFFGRFIVRVLVRMILNR